MIYLQNRNITLNLGMLKDVLSFNAVLKKAPGWEGRTRSRGADQRLRSGAADEAKGQDMVCLFGLGRDDTDAVIEALDTGAVTPRQTSSSMTCLPEVVPTADGTTYLIVNVDAMGDLEDAVDELIAFREKFPNVVVIMVSAYVLSDDFGSYRQVLCDVTLRTPLSQNRLKDGLKAAKYNNDHSMARLSAVA